MIQKFRSRLKKIVSIISNVISHDELFYVVEPSAWSIQHDGRMITSHLKSLKSKTTLTSIGIRNSIIHFGSINTFITDKGVVKPHPSNKVIVTWFHINPEDSRVNQVSAADPLVDIWHTSCSLTKEKMIQLGIRSEKICIVPLGVNTENFMPLSNDEIVKRRLQMGIPANCIVIGSFQKDGEGWSEGHEPKWIKGPDLFCDTVRKIDEVKQVFVLLSGPARGYVKTRLEESGIQYKHIIFDEPDDVAGLYKLIDLYFITSREEGGPKSILESMACSVPVISTKVGMAPDIIRHMENGLLVDIDDEEALVQCGLQVIDDIALNHRVKVEALQTAEKYDWSLIAEKYNVEIYSRLR